MQIKFCAQKVNRSSQSMLELSRVLRQCRTETEDVLCQLQAFMELEGMDACRAAILRQESSMEELTARMVGLSASLREISELYSSAESRNLYALEERPSPARSAEEIRVYETSSGIHRRIQHILY